VRKSSSSPTPVPLTLTTALLTVEDAAQVLRISRSKMYQLIRNGFPTVKIGGQRRVLPTALASWIQEQSEDPANAIPARSGQKGRNKHGKAHE